MQGVALFIGVKTTKKTTWAKVFYADLWGTREEKLARLSAREIQFSKLSLDQKMAYFIPFDEKNKLVYDKGIGVNELFPIKVTGIISGNDKAAIAPTRDELLQRVSIIKTAMDESSILNLWGKFSRGQSAEKIQNDVLSKGYITPIDFRPFDSRWTYYSGNSCGWILWPREKKIMGNLLAKPTSPIGANIGLVFSRTSRKFYPPFISSHIIAHRLFSAMCEITYIAPLYLHEERGDGNEDWLPNLNDEAFKQLTQYLSTPPSPIEIFDYIYGILHDPVYIEKFEEYLCRDFPRVPIINEPASLRHKSAFFVSEKLYKEYVATGGQLRKLHLMQEKAPKELSLEPNSADDLEIGSIKYKKGILYLNSKKQLLGIPADVWNYEIGGYKVLDKWFKEHKGESLTIDTFSHIENVAGILSETIRLQEYLHNLH